MTSVEWSITNMKTFWRKWDHSKTMTQSGCLLSLKVHLESNLLAIIGYACTIVPSSSFAELRNTIIDKVDHISYSIIVDNSSLIYLSSLGRLFCIHPQKMNHFIKYLLMLSLTFSPVFITFCRQSNIVALQSCHEFTT